MSRDPRHDILFEPVRIGQKVMRNRFYQTAHCSGAGSEKPGMQAAMRAVKAEGGWAVVTTEYCSVSPESDDFHRIGARLWDEGDVRNLSLMVDAVHEHGALAAVELVHGSVEAPAQEVRSPARGVTGTQSKYEYFRTPRPMDLEDIRQAQRELVAGAKRAQRAGFDLLTIYMAMAQGLTSNFFLPLFNTRSDEYGGSFENRARFAREVLEMVRNEIGDACAIAMRFGLDTLPPPHGLVEGGVRAEEEGLRFVEYCDDLVDLWDIQLSWAGAWGEDAAPSRTHKENHGRQYLERVKEFTSKPVVNVGRFTSPDTMADIIRSGQCDIIGAARPSIADPFLPKKIEEGRVEDIRECIGCNACVSRWAIGGPAIVCTQNATIGEEFRRGWHPEVFRLAKNRAADVLVVGAGPAGLECAVVLAKRGMSRIHIVEAEQEVGGSLRWISRLPGLQEWHRVVDYRAVQLKKMPNSIIVTSQRLTEEDILVYGAGIVIIATGAQWVADGLNGFTQRPIPGVDGHGKFLTPEMVMEGVDTGDDVLIYDTDGYFVGPGVAEYLARSGCRVTLVTPFGAVGPHLDLTLEGSRVRSVLNELGVRALTGHMLTEVVDSGGRLASLSPFEHATPEIPFDSVVFATQRLSSDSLYRSLSTKRESLKEHGISALHVVGDAFAPQHLVDTIFHAHRLAQEIDSVTPERPKPFIRERRLVGGSDKDYSLDSDVLY